MKKKDFKNLAKAVTMSLVLGTAVTVAQPVWAADPASTIFNGTGEGAIVWGKNTVADGMYTTAFGDGSHAGLLIAVDLDAAKQGVGAVAWGKDTLAGAIKLTASSAEGIKIGLTGDTTFNGNYATAWGNGAHAYGDNATAFGLNTIASGKQSTAFGNSTIASGNNATAFGNKSKASGHSATAFGVESVAQGQYSVAFGENSVAGGQNSLAALGGVTGNWTTLPVYDTENKKWIEGTFSSGGANAVAIGKGAVASADNSVAIGYYALANQTPNQIGTTDDYETQFAVGGGKDADGKTYYARITGVADGTNDHDAATVGQLNKKQDKLTSLDAGDNIVIGADGKISLATKVVQGKEGTTDANDTYAVYDKTGFKAVGYLGDSKYLTTMVDASGLNVGGDIVKVGVDAKTGLAGFVMPNGSSEKDFKVALGSVSDDTQALLFGVKNYGDSMTSDVALVRGVDGQNGLIVANNATGKRFTTDVAVGNDANGAAMLIGTDAIQLGVNNATGTGLPTAGMTIKDSVAGGNGMTGSILLGFDEASATGGVGLTVHNAGGAAAKAGGFDVRADATDGVHLKAWNSDGTVTVIPTEVSVTSETGRAGLDATGFKAAKGADFVKAGVAADGTKGFSVNDKVVAGQSALGNGTEGFAVLSTAATPASGFDILLANDKDAGSTRTALSFNVTGTGAGLSMGEIDGTNFLYSNLDWSANTANIALLDNGSNDQVFMLGDVKNANVGSGAATARVALQANGTADGLYVTGGTGVEAAIGTYKVNGTKVPMVSLKNGTASTVLDASGMNIGADKVKVGVYDTQAGVIINGKDENDTLIALGTGFKKEKGSVGTGNGLQVKSLSGDVVVAVGSMGDKTAANTGLMVTDATGKNMIMVGNTSDWGIGMLMTNGTNTITINPNGINMGSQKITNLADGTVASGSKEAVNGGQLYAHSIERLVAGSNITISGTTIDVNPVLTGLTSAEFSTKVKVGENVLTDKALRIGDSRLTSTTLKMGTEVETKSSTLTGKYLEIATETESARLTSKYLKIGENKLTVDGLTVNIAKVGDVVINGASDNKISNIADGTADGDAVNYGQLKLKADTTYVDAELAKKQDTLTAGSNLSISGTTIALKDEVVQGNATVTTDGEQNAVYNKKGLKVSKWNTSAGKAYETALDATGLNVNNIVKVGVDSANAGVAGVMINNAAGNDTLIALGTGFVAGQGVGAGNGLQVKSLSSDGAVVAVGSMGTDSAADTGLMVADSTGKNKVMVGNTSKWGIGMLMEDSANGAVTLNTTGLAIKDGTNTATLTSTALTVNQATIGGASLSSTGIAMATGQKITNLTGGTDDADAVNYGQVKGAVNGITYDTSTKELKYTTIDSATPTTVANLSSLVSPVKDKNAAGDVRVTDVVFTYDTTNNSLAWGKGTNSNGKNTTAFGYMTTASADNATAFGYQTEASGPNSTAIGYQSKATKNGSFAGGGYSTKNDSAIGGTADGRSSFAFGAGAHAVADNSVAIGKNAVASYDGAISIGTYAQTTGTGTVTDTDKNTVTHEFAVGGGVETVTLSGGGTDRYTHYSRITGVADGVNAHDAATVGQMNTALSGKQDTLTSANAGSNIAIDNGIISATDTTYTADGTNITIDAANDNKITLATELTGLTKVTVGSIVINNEGKITGLATDQQSALDSGIDSTKVTQIETNKTNIATNASDISGLKQYNTDHAWVQDAGGNVVEGKVFTYDTVSKAIMWGSATAVSGENATVFGINTTANGNNALAFGNGTTAISKNATAFGYVTIAKADNATAFGNKSNATGKASTAFGVKSVAGGENSLAALGGVTGTWFELPGYNSTTKWSDGVLSNTPGQSGANAVAIGVGANAKVDNSVAIGQYAVASSASAVDSSKMTITNEFAVGGGKDTNGYTYYSRITGVADGVNAHDAVNYGQLSAHTTNTDIHVTTTDKSNWNAKQERVEVSGGNLVLANDNKTLSLATALTGMVSAEFSGNVKAGSLTIGTATGDAWDVTNGLKATKAKFGGKVAINKDGIDMGSQKITKLAKGSVASGSTDAVTGGQLYDYTTYKNNGLNFAADDSVKDAAKKLDKVIGAYSSISGNYVGTGTISTDMIALDTKVKANETAISGLGSTKADLSYIDSRIGSATDNEINVGEGETSYVIGKGNKVTGDKDTVVGFGNIVVGTGSGAFGDPNVVYGNGSYAFGNDNSIGDVNNRSDKSFAIGNNNVVRGPGAFAIGNGAQATTDDALAFGNASKATAYDAVAVGHSASASGENSVALGYKANTTAKDSVALGSFSVADVENTVSVGSSDKKRKIVNVAAGDISENSTDAVNGGQLYTTNQAVAANTSAIAERKIKDLGEGEANLALAEDGTLTLKKALTGMTSAEFSGDVKAGSVTVGTNYLTTEGLTIGSNYLSGSELKIGNSVLTDYGLTVNGSSLNSDGLTVGTNYLTSDGLTVNKAKVGDIAVNDDGKITGLADGTAEKDAVNYGQMNTAITAAVAAVESPVRSASDDSVSIKSKVFTYDIDKKALSWGESTSATGNHATAFGNKTTASGANSVAFGVNTEATANQAFALGNNTHATGNNSIASGQNTTAKGNNSVALGNGSKAGGNNSIAALGGVTGSWNGDSYEKGGNSAIAIGSHAIATKDYSVAIGQYAQTGQVTIGKGDANTVINEFAVGGGKVDGKTYYSQITGVAEGTNAHDAATYGQVINYVDNNLTLENATGASEVGKKLSLKSDLTGLNSAEFTSQVKVGDNYLTSSGLTVGTSALTDGALTIGTTALTSEQLRVGGNYLTSSGLTVGDTAVVASGLSIADGPSLTKDSGLVINSDNSLTSFGLKATSVAVGDKTYISSNGLNANNQKITNVADAVDEADAVNYKQLKGLVADSNPIRDKAGNAVTEQVFTYDTTKRSLAWGVLDGDDRNIASGNHATAFGKHTLASGANSVAFGVDTEASGNQAFAFGNNTLAYGNNSTAFGHESEARGQNSTAFGRGSRAGGANSLAALGGETGVWNSNVYDNGGANALAIGVGAKAQKDATYAIGTNAVVSAENGIALGNNANVSAANSVALGAGSVATEANTISVGAVGAERKIANVEAVKVEKGGTYAATTGQVYDATHFKKDGINYDAGDHVRDAIKNLDTIVGDYSAVKDSANYAKTGNIADDMIALDAAISGHDVAISGLDKRVASNAEAIKGLNETVIPGLDARIASNAEAIKGLNTVASGLDQRIASNKESIDKIHDRIGIEDVVITGKNSVAFGNKNTVTGDGTAVMGYGNTVTGNQTSVVGYGNKVVGDSSGAFGDPNYVYGDRSYAFGNNNSIGTESVRVHDAFAIGNGNKVTGQGGYAIGNNVVVSGDHSVAFGNGAKVTGSNSVALGSGSVASADNVVSVGDVGKERRITNVAPGQDATDAATVGQVSGLKYDLDSLNSHVNKLDNRVNKVGAGAAALAALHPLDFDPDNKLAFSAGVGNYKGENAAALGVFYRPMDRVMFSMGGTIGNDNNMVNAGVTFALDRKVRTSDGMSASSYKKASREVLVDEVYLLNAENTKMNDKMDVLNDENTRLSDRMQAMERKLAQQAAINRKQLAEKDAKFEKAMAEQNAKIAALMEMLEKATKK